METSDIYRHAIEAVGAKRVAHALGVSLGHTYRLQRPTMDIDADGTGARSDLDRIEALVDLLASRPEGRPVLVEMRGYLTSTLDRALGAWEGGALTESRLLSLQGKACREVGEALVRCDWHRLEPDAARKEIREAIAALEEMDAAIGQGLEDEADVKLARRLVG